MAANPNPVTYVASRASIQARGLMWRELRSRGANINSSWLDADVVTYEDMEKLWLRIEQEITEAEQLVVYVEPRDFPLKGAYVEVGMAIALKKPVFVVAPGLTLNEAMNPLGSWAAHPGVKRVDNLDEVLFSSSI